MHFIHKKSTYKGAFSLPYTYFIHVSHKVLLEEHRANLEVSTHSRKEKGEHYVCIPN